MRCCRRPARRALYERSDTSAREREGLAPATGWLRGARRRAAAPTEVEIREHGWRFGVDVADGHKTGFYLDQRDNRKLFADSVRHFGCRARAQLLLLHRRLQRRRARRRRGAGDGDRLVGAGARARRRQRRPQRLRRGAPRGARRRRQPDACARCLEPSDARFDAIVLDPPKLAPTRGARRARRARLQGHQPARADAAARRAARCSRSRARAASTPTCSTRSSPAPASMPASTASSMPASAPRPTTR